MSHLKTALLLLGSLAGVAAVTSANANPHDESSSIVIKYSAQVLDTDSGVKELYRRITLAAAQVCPDFSMLDLAAQEHVKQCRNQAIAKAVHQIDNSKLAALYASHSKNG
jgi:UrcA family protein